MFKLPPQAGLPKWGVGLAGVLSAACWGLAAVMSKGVLEFVPPFTLLVVQLVASVTFLWLVVMVQHLLPSLSWKTLRLGLTGLLEPGLTYTFIIIGLTLTTASHASLLIGATEPLMIIGLAWLLLGERVTLLLVALAGLALVGVGMVLGINPTTSNSHSLLGDLLVVIGIFCSALYIVLTRRLIIDLAPLPLTALQQTVGLLWALLIWPVGLLRGEARSLTEIGFGSWTWAATSGITQYALGYWFYLIALKRMPANLASLFLTLIPVFGVGGAYLFLDEQLTAQQWIGVGLTFVTVLNISRLHR